MTPRSVRYYFSEHALLRFAQRHAPLGITLDDVLAVIVNPAKVAAGLNGCTNAYGLTANGIRIRVTYHPVRRQIRTITLADSRYPA